MITMFSIALLSSAASLALDADTMRKNYNNCLVDFTIEHLDLKTGVGPFRKAAEDACQSERDAMAAAIKKDEMQFGSSEAEATEYAEEEVGGVLFAFTDMYGGYLNGNTRPVKEN